MADTNKAPKEIVQDDRPGIGFKVSKFPSNVDSKDFNMSGYMTFFVYSSDYKVINGPSDTSSIDNATNTIMQNSFSAKDAATAQASMIGAANGKEVGETLGALTSAAAVGGGKGGVSLNPLNALKDLAIKGAATVAGGVVGALAGRALAREKTQCIASVTLPMPEIKFDYKQDWKLTDMPIKNVATLVNNMVESGKAAEGGMINGAWEGAKTMANDVVNYLPFLVSGDVGGENGGKDFGFAGSQYAMRDITGMVPNPHKTMVYNGPSGTRIFTFTYKLSPSNESEAASIAQIIKTFKSYSAPMLHRSKMLYQYPAEFKIVSYAYDGSKWRINSNIPKIAPSVLTNVNVTYLEAGTGYAMIQSSNGGLPVPAIINLTLSFQELYPLTRDDINAGF